VHAELLGLDDDSFEFSAQQIGAGGGGGFGKFGYTVPMPRRISTGLR